MTTAHADEPSTASSPKPDRTFENAIRSAIHPLMRQVTGPNTHRPGPAKGTMANLRRAAGRQTDDPMAWAECTQMLLEHGGAEWVLGDEPTAAERASFIAITYWALHQQSQEKPMHESYGGAEKYKNFGYTVGQLSTQVDSNSTKGRLDAVLLAGELHSLQHHLRTLIQLLRAKALPVDYGLLAKDLRDWINAGDRRREVTLRWGRGFSRGQYQKKTTTHASDNPASDG